MSFDHLFLVIWALACRPLGTAAGVHGGCGMRTGCPENSLPTNPQGNVWAIFRSVVYTVGCYSTMVCWAGTHALGSGHPVCLGAALHFGPGGAR